VVEKVRNKKGKDNHHNFFSPERERERDMLRCLRTHVRKAKKIKKLKFMLLITKKVEINIARFASESESYEDFEDKIMCLILKLIFISFLFLLLTNA
jgi:hypothetical protein